MLTSWLNFTVKTFGFYRLLRSARLNFVHLNPLGFSRSDASEDLEG